MKPILKPGRTCEGFHDADRTGVFVDGRAYFRAFVRAASAARDYILIAGWQFDRDTRLLRGADDRRGIPDDAVIPFLNGLCEKNPGLRVCILIWDYSAVFALDRQWFQKQIIDLTFNERIHFRYDDKHPLGASHHQKLVVVDGAVGLAGGMDIARGRWDDRRHLASDPERVGPDGASYEATHDVQAFVTGPAAWRLAGIFQERWVRSGGGELILRQPDEPFREALGSCLPLPAERIAISRTVPRTLKQPGEPVREIRALYVDAIAAADKIIYLENQYFSSQALYQALMERMAEPDRPRLQIVMMLPRRPHSMLEELSLGIRQAKMCQDLKDQAARHGHGLGIYYTAPEGAQEGTDATFIHAKLLMVDDRFLTVGSANTTNRSFGLDTELNLSWEATAPGPLAAAIRRVRTSLLMEHTGSRGSEARRGLRSVTNIVDHLNGLAESGRSRLRSHPLESVIPPDMLPGDLKPSLDPEKPILEENIFELLARKKGEH